MGLVKRILSGFGRAARDFDASFYLSHYKDLALFRTRRQALNHYLRHGRAEGRFGNERQYLLHLETVSPDLRAGFDVAAYKFYNKDLAQKFSTDEEFFRHYLNHGHQEGRISQFPQDADTVEVLPDAEKWQAIFRTSEFLAWCGDELTKEAIARPVTRAEAIALFRAKGIDRLWPINFEYAFDVDFVRANSTASGHRDGSDADLYRAWLAEGFVAGAAPNERVFLAPFLGERPFPADFDWKAFARRHAMAPATTRSQALVALFNATYADVMHAVDLRGSDAGWLMGRIGARALVLGDSAKAIAMLERSTAIVPTGDTLSLLGDARRARGAVQLALEAYEASTRIERAPIWSFLHAATLYAGRRQFAQAFEILRRAHPVWRQRAEFAAKLHEIVELYFEERSAAAHGLYRQAIAGEVSRETADALLTDALDEIRDIYADLDAMPVPRGGNPEGYVAILANDDLRQCTHYRVEQKALQFEQAGIPVRIFSHGDVQGFADCLIGARAAIFYRVPAVPAILRVIQHANAMGLQTYYEIDDLNFDAHVCPDPFASFEGQISAIEYAGLMFGVPLFRYAMSMCKGTIASTPALADRMRSVAAGGTGPSIVVRNGLDARNDAMIRVGASPLHRRGNDARIRIFYGSGTKAHNADFNRLAAPALIDLMRLHAHIDLVIVGHLKPCEELAAMGERIITYPFTPDVTAYWSILASCDINLAVLEAGPVADCKSEIKWLEASVLRIPSVVSDTQTYREVIGQGEDGFIVSDRSDWRVALEKLIVDPALRERMGDAARQKALRDYDVDVAARTLTSVFGSGVQDGEPKQARRLRVLVCNVFFAPQSYGGATRVVEDNVKAFVAHYPDMDVGVFCSDEGATPPGHLRLDAENGVPVYRLAVAQHERMDWQAFNEDHARPFERVLDDFRPDIIHFHCIQRLTATIVEVALRRHVPYIVTLHDAWWISDDQFLVDGDGLLQLPGTDVLADCADRRNPAASIARRQRLASLLRASRTNVSVSASFAEIYAQAGIHDVKVAENGVSPIGEVIRSPRSDGRISLGHVGGRAAHKGAGLVEAVVRRGRYDRLHLTMVDGTLAPGEQVETTWGTTPVTLSAPYPQGEIARLYGKLDVLLAPSTWPESFGLVTREATLAGLWVIASDLGAIGQEVEHGRNGYVVDVTTTAGLAKALAKIDADPERHRAPAPCRTRPPLPTPDIQAAELHALYTSIYAKPLY